MSRSIPAVGDMIGEKYLLVRLLGRGGMGVVFEATNTATRKRVAVKWIDQGATRDPHHKKRALREAQAASQIRHPNVVDVYDVIDEQDALLLVMELLEGESLAVAFGRQPAPVESEELLHWLLPAMRGVASAHARHIIHRDIKPDNIFLATVADQSYPTTKVLDFGIAKFEPGATDVSGEQLTEAGTLLGTPHYMPLEQLCGQPDLDPRVDIYAFGVVLYEGLAGRVPYDAPTPAALALKLASSQPIALRSLRPDLPAGLVRIVERAMARDREHRFSSLRALTDSLEPYARRDQPVAPRSGPDRGAYTPLQPRSPRRVSFLTSFLTSPLTALAALTLFLGQEPAGYHESEHLQIPIARMAARSNEKSEAQVLEHSDSDAPAKTAAPRAPGTSGASDRSASDDTTSNRKSSNRTPPAPLPSGSVGGAGSHGEELPSDLEPPGHDATCTIARGHDVTPQAAAWTAKIAEQQPALSTCYRRAMARSATGPDLAYARLHVHLDLGDDGRVEAVRLGEPVEAELSACLKTVLLRPRLRDGARDATLHIQLHCLITPRIDDDTRHAPTEPAAVPQ